MLADDLNLNLKDGCHVAATGDDLTKVRFPLISIAFECICLHFYCIYPDFYCICIAFVAFVADLGSILTDRGVSV